MQDLDSSIRKGPARAGDSSCLLLTCVMVLHVWLSMQQHWGSTMPKISLVAKFVCVFGWGHYSCSSLDKWTRVVNQKLLRRNACEMRAHSEELFTLGVLVQTQTPLSLVSHHKSWRPPDMSISFLKPIIHGIYREVAWVAYETQSQNRSIFVDDKQCQDTTPNARSQLKEKHKKSVRKTEGSDTLDLSKTGWNIYL